MSVPVLEFPSRQAAMRKLIGLLDTIGASPRPQELVEVWAVSTLLVGELGQLADQAAELLDAAGYRTEVRALSKLDAGRLG